MISRRAWPASWSTPPPISKVVPETNSLTYRGYPVQDLAAHCSFEQVAYLLWHGELPTDAELALFCQRERASRRLDRSMLSLLAKLPDNCHPMDVVRTAISYLGAEDPDEDDESANRAKALRMLAVLPTIVAVDMRRRRGLAPIAPHSGPGLHRELPEDVLRRGARTGDREGVRAVDDPVRRARFQRIHLRRAGGDVDAVGHLQRGDRRRSARSRARCTAARTRR